MTVLRVGGIPVRLHLSFVVLVVGLVGLAGMRGGAVSAWLTFGALGCLYGSVLAHELGHAAMAARLGIPTVGITLLPFGGYAQLERRRVDARIDLAVSLAGPLTNLAMAVVLMTGATFASSRWVAYLALMNVALGLLNLVPALPLDGGRVLRALLVPSQGLDDANRLTLRVGLVLIVLVAMVGAWFEQLGIVAMAIFVGVLHQREHVRPSA